MIKMTEEKRSYIKRELPTRSCDDAKQYFREYYQKVTKPKLLKQKQERLKKELQDLHDELRGELL